VRRITAVLANATLAVAAGSSSAAGEHRDPSVAGEIESVIVDLPASPEPAGADRFRACSGSFFAPAADFGALDVDLSRPEVQLRLRFPLDDAVSLQLTGNFSASLYDAEGPGPIFEGCPSCPLPNDLYSASLGTQAGYVFKRSRHLFRSDERWALLASAFARARWEPGALGSSFTPGVSFGLGYELPARLRIGISAHVERDLDGAGVDLTPVGYLRWDIAPKLELRNRGVGLQLDYEATDQLDLFATGYRSSDRFRLDDRPGISSGPTLRDVQVLVGGGLVCVFSRAFRLTAEAGAILDRSIRVETRDDGKLDSTRSDASAYVAFRLELRP
jgi:hypothetical protein